MLRILRQLREATIKSFEHDVLGTAKAAAYSAILGVFPALLVLTAVLAVAPGSYSLRGEVRGALDEILPREVMDLAQAYLQYQHQRSIQVLFTAVFISMFGGMGVMLSLMEGFRRAYRIKRNAWNFWKQHILALLLIPSCLVPMASATLVVIFGHQIELWMIANANFGLRSYVLIFWMVVRWTIAMATCVSVLTVIYHFGTPHPHSWKWVLPGALLSTVLWFVTTLLFGWYVTRFADYSVVYGSLGAAVATLVWLYITSVAVLFGGEFNARIAPLPATPALPTGGGADEIAVTPDRPPTA
ncbi:MAG TPA: YihY/virulence factor BrkB family protein [Acidisarcina sp.]|nr:YihY/virulence factor BrkB family protein [Acidisarcina sp.]